jgi:UDPglucose 6-dehydrogenase
MKIAVIGTGYVGLVTAAVFAKLSNDVFALDIDEKKIASLKNGKAPFYEPELEDLIKSGIASDKLYFTSSYKDAVSEAEVVFICVGTPAKKNGDYDLSFVLSASKSIAKSLTSYSVVCIKSTVPPSTTKKVSEVMDRFTDVSYDLASCPEFLKEGSAVLDSFNPSRIVIGADSKKARDILLKLHEPIKTPRVVCDIKSAQMIKYAANAFLAAKISFINSIARLCDKAGADIDKVSEGLGLDPRIGNKFLNAGLGYGGSCFPKDTWALIAYAERLGYNFKFLKEVDNINQNQIDYFLSKLKFLAGSVKGKTVTVLGLSFKPNTDDIRESRAIPIIKKLINIGVKVKVCDPVAVENAKKIKGFSKVLFFTDPYKALEGSSALILVTEWDEFKNLDFKKIGDLMKEKAVLDGRNVFDAAVLQKLGFSYAGIGRGKA